MPVNPFSFSNICLLMISAGLIAYLRFVWYVLQQKTPPTMLAAYRKPVLRFTAFYTGFLILISVLAANRFFAVITMPPRFLLIFVPLVGMVVLVSNAKFYRSLAFLRFLPPALLIGIHVYRLLIELVFIRFTEEKVIPVELSLHGRNFDMLIGILAIPVAWLFSRQHPAAHKAGIAFNVAGLLSLANIFSIVIPSMPSPFRVYNTLYLPTYFPGIIIVFLVSAAILLHILSLRQLLSARERAVSKIEKTETGKGAVSALT